MSKQRAVCSLETSHQILLPTHDLRLAPACLSLFDSLFVWVSLSAILLLRNEATFVYPRGRKHSLCLQAFVCRECALMYCMKYEPKGFIAEIASERRREPRVSVPMFLEEVPYSRNTLPPLVPVEVRTSTSHYPMNGMEVAALIHTACHVSFMSATLVGELSMRQDVIPDTSVPPSPLSSGTGVPWLVEGKLRYVELSLKGSKHVTQLHVARDLPSDLVLGVDFLKKAQVRVNFPENCIFLPNGGQETKVSFLTNKEMNQHQRRSTNNTNTTPAKTRAYSSNY
ncbi:uncharacterized protein LOC122257205 [Penaeus japonicus]|uniref:uncharacterized protein LOC122257205 n=1 Tax=Penaeus japonicus TaxID=27405 RepID=UPI001C7147F9|nr:uncharacterized protein LOC122257205 [Penaeus japonicus]